MSKVDKLIAKQLKMKEFLKHHCDESEAVLVDEMVRKMNYEILLARLEEFLGEPAE